MSLYPVLWAAEHAPVLDAEERAILMALVIKGDFDGSNCFRSYSTLARVARVDAKTVGRRCRAMEQRGILRRQTQHLSKAWLAIPEKQRPVVWEVMIPADWWSSAQLAGLNEQRESLGRPALSHKTRPPLPEAPPKKTRTDKGTKKPRKKAPLAADPGTTSPGGNPGTTSPHPQDSQSPPPGLVVPQPSETPPETPPLSPPHAPGTAGADQKKDGPAKPKPAEEVEEAFAQAYFERHQVKPPRTTVRFVARDAHELLDSGWEVTQLKKLAAELPRWGKDLVKHAEASLRGAGILVPGQHKRSKKLPEACEDHDWLPGQNDVSRRWREGPDGSWYKCPACNPESPRYPSADVSPPSKESAAH